MLHLSNSTDVSFSENDKLSNYINNNTSNEDWRKSVDSHSSDFKEQLSKTMFKNNFNKENSGEYDTQYETMMKNLSERKPSSLYRKSYIRNAGSMISPRKRTLSLAKSTHEIEENGFETDKETQNYLRPNLEQRPKSGSSDRVVTPHISSRDNRKPSPLQTRQSRDKIRKSRSSSDRGSKDRSPCRHCRDEHAQNSRNRSDRVGKDRSPCRDCRDEHAQNSRNRSDVKKNDKSEKQIQIANQKMRHSDDSSQQENSIISAQTRKNLTEKGVDDNRGFSKDRKRQIPHAIKKSFVRKPPSERDVENEKRGYDTDQTNADSEALDSSVGQDTTDNSRSDNSRFYHRWLKRKRSNSVDKTTTNEKSPADRKEGEIKKHTLVFSDKESKSLTESMDNLKNYKNTPNKVNVVKNGRETTSASRQSRFLTNINEPNNTRKRKLEEMSVYKPDAANSIVNNTRGKMNPSEKGRQTFLMKDTAPKSLPNSSQSRKTIIKSDKEDNSLISQSTMPSSAASLKIRKTLMLRSNEKQTELSEDNDSINKSEMEVSEISKQSVNRKRTFRNTMSVFGNKLKGKSVTAGRGSEEEYSESEISDTGEKSGDQRKTIRNTVFNRAGKSNIFRSIAQVSKATSLFKNLVIKKFAFDFEGKTSESTTEKKNTFDEWSQGSIYSSNVKQQSNVPHYYFRRFDYNFGREIVNFKFIVISPVGSGSEFLKPFIDSIQYRKKVHDYVRGKLHRLSIGKYRCEDRRLYSIEQKCRAQIDIQKDNTLHPPNESAYLVSIKGKNDKTVLKVLAYLENLFPRMMATCIFLSRLQKTKDFNSMRYPEEENFIVRKYDYHKSRQAISVMGERGRAIDMDKVRSYYLLEKAQETNIAVTARSTQRFTYYDTFILEMLRDAKDSTTGISQHNVNNSSIADNKNTTTLSSSSTELSNVDGYKVKKLKMLYTWRSAALFRVCSDGKYKSNCINNLEKQLDVRFGPVAIEEYAKNNIYSVIRVKVYYRNVEDIKSITKTINNYLQHKTSSKSL